MVLYYSLAGGFLFSWLISPGTGIVKFHEVYLGDAPRDFQEGDGTPKGFGAGVAHPYTLEQYIANAREALGVDTYNSRVSSNSETESEAGDLLEQQFEELNNKCTSSSNPTGCRRMVSRNHLFNRSYQSKTSLYSATMSPVKDRCLSSPLRPSNTEKPPLRALYDLLIAPMEGGLMHNSGPVGRHRQLILVLEGELYLIPFALLKGSSSNEYLYERFSLIAMPSLTSLEDTMKVLPHRGGPLFCPDGGSVAAVVGAPHLPPNVMDRWLWGPLPSAHEEALWLGDQLGCHPLTGTDATKEHALAALNQAECVHFATHISWRLAALVLAPSQEHVGAEKANTSFAGPSLNGTSMSGEKSHQNRIAKSPSTSEDLNRADSGGEESFYEVDSTCDSPPLQDFLLTAADILDLSLNVKLVVLRLYPESSSKITADGVVGLTRAFLAAGVQCVCVSLWPVPIAASKLFTHTFYNTLLNGTKASAALTEAMRTLQTSNHFSHPSNWAGYVLIGSDVNVNSTMSLVGQALTEILQYPEKARDALRVILHLVEKSLQRIHSGQCNPMYTSQQSVENKVGGVPGWQPLLSAVGFQMDFSGGAGLPAAVFFPTSDPGDCLQQCSTTLQSLLGLSPPALQALCKLVTVKEAGEQLIHKLHHVLVQLQSADKDQDFSLAPIQVSISVQLWRLPGCHEFLAALGFDLCEVGQEEVVLKTGKQASRRSMHFALQSLLALFDSSELPKRLSMDSSSSLESLSSSQSTSQPHSLPVSLGCYPQSTFLPPVCQDSLSCDAISVYSFSSLASSLSFLSRPEPAGSDIISQRSHPPSQRHATARSQRRLTNNGGVVLGEGQDEEYQGYSIISSEPIGQSGRECDTLPAGHRCGRGSAGRGESSAHGYPITGSSKGSMSSSTSPTEALHARPDLRQSNLPSQKNGKGKASSSESDQSSTETDSTVKSQEERTGPAGALDPQELAMKILQETESHMQAVETLEKANGRSIVPLKGSQENRTSFLQTPATPIIITSKKQFKPSETSAFTRPPSRTSTKTSVAVSTPSPKPKPLLPSSSSLSDMHSQSQQHYPTSSAQTHSCRSISRSSSPTLSYSATRSISASSSPASSSPANTPDQKQSKQGKKNFHNLKNFWTRAAQKHDVPCPASLLQGGNKKMSTVQKDVLGLLNLSPQHKSSTKRSEGHQMQGTKPSSASHESTYSKDGHLSANGNMIFSPGNVFPSSKC